MKHPAMNPYLPLWEYVPDGEPRVWGNQLYVYGSHDVAGSTQFCEGDYVVWSAPLEDLGDWKYEGISYPYTATTASLEEGGNLAAPDCVQGPDGRYYLYTITVENSTPAKSPSATRRRGPSTTCAT